MKLARRLLIVPVVLATVLYGLGMASLASAESGTPLPMPPNSAQIVLPPSCAYVDGDVVCTVERPNGVQQISASMSTGVGSVEVFNETYGGCPTSVEFVLDPIVLDYPTSFQIVSCPPPVAVSDPGPGSLKDLNDQGRPVIIGGLTNAR